MLGLLLIYFIGRNFFKLAEKYEKHKWGAAIGGVVSYYGGTFVFGIAYALIVEFVLDGSIDDTSDLLLGVMALPFGLLSCYLVYQLLKRNWSKNAVPDSDSLDSELIKEFN